MQSFLNIASYMLVMRKKSISSVSAASVKWQVRQNTINIIDGYTDTYL